MKVKVKAFKYSELKKSTTSKSSSEFTSTSKSTKHHRRTKIKGFKVSDKRTKAVTSTAKHQLRVTVNIVIKRRSRIYGRGKRASARHLLKGTSHRLKKDGDIVYRLQAKNRTLEGSVEVLEESEEEEERESDEEERRVICFRDPKTGRFVSRKNMHEESPDDGSMDNAAVTDESMGQGELADA